MADLVSPDQLQKYVPGEVLLSSEALGWGEVSMRAYRYGASDVNVPALRDFVIVTYRDGVTHMHRRVDGPWQAKRAVPGSVSILTRAEECQWVWDAPIDVIHVYLTRQLLAKVSADAFDKDIADVQLQDVLSTEDDLVKRSLNAIADEVQANNLGGRLYVDAISTQLCVHLLRNYANVQLREPREVHGLSHMQERVLNHYIESNLDRQLSLEELAAVTRTSTSHFLRQFKARFGVPPHAYVLRMRLERAQHLLKRTHLPIKDISAQSGFSDQSHMTRVFQRFLKTTPHLYRQTAAS